MPWESALSTLNLFAPHIYGYEKVFIAPSIYPARRCTKLCESALCLVTYLFTEILVRGAIGNWHTQITWLYLLNWLLKWCRCIFRELFLNKYWTIPMRSLTLNLLSSSENWSKKINKPNHNSYNVSNTAAQLVVPHFTSYLRLICCYLLFFTVV